MSSAYFPVIKKETQSIETYSSVLYLDTPELEILLLTYSLEQTV